MFGPHTGEIWTKADGQKNTKILSFLTETRDFSNYFRQSFDAILKDVSFAETIVECLTINLQTTIYQRSKYYGSPTRVNVQK